jgi:hypothetical protein
MSNVLMVTIRVFVALRGAHKLWGWVWALIAGAGSGRQAALGTACFWARARSGVVTPLHSPTDRNGSGILNLLFCVMFYCFYSP